jgi:hypothetical protein
MGDRRGTYRFWWKKLRGKRPLGRPKLRWEDNIRWILRKWNVGLYAISSWRRIETRDGHL